MRCRRCRTGKRGIERNWSMTSCYHGSKISVVVVLLLSFCKSRGRTKWASKLPGQLCLRLPGKIHYSVLTNQRLLEHVVFSNILHESQIGFSLKNRTADHVFTLRTFIETTLGGFIITRKRSMPVLWISKKLSTRPGMSAFCISSSNTR